MTKTLLSFVICHLSFVTYSLWRCWSDAMWKDIKLNFDNFERSDTFGNLNKIYSHAHKREGRARTSGALSFSSSFLSCAEAAKPEEVDLLVGCQKMGSKNSWLVGILQTFYLKS